MTGLRRNLGLLVAFTALSTGAQATLVQDIDQDFQQGVELLRRGQDAPDVFEGPAQFWANGEGEGFDGHLRVFNQDRGDRETQVLPLGLETGKVYKPTEVTPSPLIFCH